MEINISNKQTQVFEALRYAEQHLRKYDFKSVIGHAHEVSVEFTSTGKVQNVVFYLIDNSEVRIHSNGSVHWYLNGKLHRNSGLPATYGKHYTQYFEHGEEKLCLDEKGMIRFDGKQRRDAYGLPVTE